MKKTKMFMLVLTSAVLALTPVTANAAEADRKSVVYLQNGKEIIPAAEGYRDL